MKDVPAGAIRARRLPEFSASRNDPGRRRRSARPARRRSARAPAVSSAGWEHIMNPDVACPRNDYSRVPFWLYHDAAIYEQEMERIFRGPVWNYLCLEAEIPKPGDFRTTWVGDTPVLISRGTNGEIFACENRCAHRGALVRREI